jgi:catechol 2,3-dioxygenase-like lactoylglutathione lyase family enzyme
MSQAKTRTQSNRVHIGLAISDLDAAILFYSALFDLYPSKVRPGYAKFEVREPALNLTLNVSSGPLGPRNVSEHFGIEVSGPEGVRALAARLARSGLRPREEFGVTCCYAVQDKVWVSDPDGNQWEIFVVLESEGVERSSPQSACCDAKGAGQTIQRDGEENACCARDEESQSREGARQSCC